MRISMENEKQKSVFVAVENFDEMCGKKWRMVGNLRRQCKNADSFGRKKYLYLRATFGYLPSTRYRRNRTGRVMRRKIDSIGRYNRHTGTYHRPVYLRPGEPKPFFRRPTRIIYYFNEPPPPTPPAVSIAGDDYKSRRTQCEAAKTGEPTTI